LGQKKVSGNKIQRIAVRGGVRRARYGGQLAGLVDSAEDGDDDEEERKAEDAEVEGEGGQARLLLSVKLQNLQKANCKMGSLNACSRGL